MGRHTFILSSGRTATRFLAEYFSANALEPVWAKHEPFPSRLLRLVSHAHLDGRIPDAVAIALLRLSHPGMGRGEKVQIESNPLVFGLADLLEPAFPGVRIVHVVRDPRDFVVSAFNHSFGFGAKGWFSRHIPFWYPDLARLSGRPVGFEAPFEYLAVWWDWVNRVLEEAGQPLEERYLRLRYEDLVGEDRRTMEVLATFLGVHLRPEGQERLRRDKKVNAGQLRAMTHWRNWSSDQACLIDAVCGALMTRYGYGGEEVWLRHLDPPR